MNSTADLTHVAQEAHDWFFNEYFTSWVDAAKNPSVDPRFILHYWTPPLHISADDPDPGRAKYGWCPDADSVMEFLATHQAPLKAAGYTHTNVPDSRVTAYSSRSAAIDVIWSRRSGDDTEIERLALHFEVRRDNPHGSWGIIAISGHPTETDRLDDAWFAIQR